MVFCLIKTYIYIYYALDLIFVLQLLDFSAVGCYQAVYAPMTQSGTRHKGLVKVQFLEMSGYTEQPKFGSGDWWTLDARKRQNRNSSSIKNEEKGKLGGKNERSKNH
jgi:hypothetical protein